MTPCPRIHQVVAVLEAADAVGNEVRMLQRLLTGRGCESEVFVLERRPGQSQPMLDELLAGPVPDAVLYHYAISSPATAVLVDAGLPLVLIDHNSTPARYFELIDRDHLELCRATRRERTQLRGHVRLALGKSDFTRSELDALGFRPTAVFPSLTDTASHRGQAPGPLCNEAAAHGPVLLTVGRVAPNKRIDDCIRVLHAYRRGVDRSARLWVVGDWARLPVYRRALDRLAAALGEDGVRFLGPVTQTELLDCYRGAAVYLSMSEHEGFCVPLLEAMLNGLPIVARPAAAVPDTLGAAGLTARGRPGVETAELIERLIDDPALRRRQVALGRRRAARLDPERSVDGLLRSLAAVDIAVPA